MKKYFYKWFRLAQPIVIVWVVFFSVIERVKSEENKFSVSGYVADAAGKPLQGVAVHLHEIQMGTFTNDIGKFSLSNVKKGHYHLHATLLGYKSASLHIDLHNDTTIYVVLTPTEHSLNEVIVETHPAKLSQTESSLHTLLITEEDIQKNASGTLMQTLEKLPGVSAISLGVGIAKPVIRGLAFNRVQVSDNGIRQEGQQWGADHGLEIDQFAVEAVEILKGPASLIYGSDAMAGVINIRHPKPLVSGSHQVNAQAIYRSVNYTYGATAQAKGNKNGYIYKVRITGLDFGDYQVPATQFNYNRYILPIFNQTLKNTAGQERNVSAIMGVNKNWGYTHLTVSNFNQKSGLFPGIVGPPRAYQLQPDESHRNINVPYQYVNHFKVVSNSSVKIHHYWLEIDAAYQNNLRQEHTWFHSDGPVPRTNSTLALQLLLQTYSANLRLLMNKNEIRESVAGVQAHFQTNHSNGFAFLMPDFNARSVGLFWIEKYKFSERLFFHAGLRGDAAQVSVKKGQQLFFRNNNETDVYWFIKNEAFNRTFTNISGAAGGSYHASPKWNLKANVARTFRYPAPYELAANGMHHGTFRFERGNQNLNPETGYQTDIGVFFESKKWTASFTPYFNYFRNFIYSSPTGQFNEYGGGQVYATLQTQALHTGFEAQLSAKPTRNLEIQTQAEYVWAQNLATMLPLPFTPPFSWYSQAQYTFFTLPYLFKNMYVLAGAGYYAAQNRVDRNERATPGYAIFNTGIGSKWGKTKDYVSFYFQIQNLTNARYMNHLSRYRLLNLPEPGRNFVVGLLFTL